MEEETKNLIENVFASVSELQQQLFEAEKLNDPLEKCIQTLAAFHEFVKRLELCDKGGNWPLCMLRDSLVDLREGCRPKLLEPRMRDGRRGRPKTSTPNRMVPVLCAAVMDCYITAGLRRDEAAARTARKLEKRAKTVEGWRDRLMGPASSEAKDRDDKLLFDRLREYGGNKSVKLVDEFASWCVTQNFLARSIHQETTCREC